MTLQIQKQQQVEKETGEIGEKEYPKVQNRWLVVFAAVLLELALGAIYAWGVYVPTLTEMGWTSSQTTIPFSISLASFAVVVVVAGKLKEILGATKLIMLSAIFLGGGYILAGLLPLTPLSLVLTIGLIGGSGMGFSYALPISVGIKWFPDMKGLVTGLSMAGYGVGALIWYYAYVYIFDNLQTAFVSYGICYALMIGTAMFFLYDPPEHYTVETNETEVETIEVKVYDDFTPGEMLRTPQFYAIFFTYMFGVGAGLMVIGIAKSWPEQFLPENIVLIAAAVIYPLFNGLGRIIWGIFAEKMGWKKAILIMNSVQTVFFVSILFLVKSPIGLFLGIAVIAFNYGGNFSLFPMATLQTYGPKNISTNYGWVFLSYGIGGIIIPMAGALLADANLQNVAFYISAITLGLTVLLISRFKTPKKLSN